MKKIIKVFFCISVFILINNCGYSINKTSKNYYFQTLEVDGSSKVKNKIKNQLTRSTNAEAKNKISAVINVTEEKTVKEKAKTGKVISYNLKYTILLQLNNQNKVLKRSFTSEGSYEVGSFYTDMIENEKKLREQLVMNAASEIDNYLIRLFRNVN